MSKLTRLTDLPEIPIQIGQPNIQDAHGSYSKPKPKKKKKKKKSDRK